MNKLWILGRVGQNRTSAPYMSVCVVISLLKILYVTVFTYECMVLASPNPWSCVGVGVYMRFLPNLYISSF